MKSEWGGLFIKSIVKLEISEHVYKVTGHPSRMRVSLLLGDLKSILCIMTVFPLYVHMHRKGERW